MYKSLPSIPLDLDGVLRIDNSGWVESLMNCETLVRFKQLHKRIPSGDKPALNFGSAIHLGLEYRYVRYQNRPVDDQYYEVVSGLLLKHFEENPVPEGDFRTINWALELLRRYNNKYSFEEFNLLTYDTPVACPQCDGIDTALCPWCAGSGKRDVMVEIGFDIPFCQVFDASSKTHIPVNFTGRIDLPLLFDGELYVLDHKTTSMLGVNFWEEKRAAAQFKGYAWAFHQATGKLPHGFAVNALRTKEPPQYVLNGTTSARAGKTQSPESWWNESLARQRFVLRVGELEEWKENTIHLLQLFFDQYAKGFLPRRTTNCITKYGRCPYFEVCHTYPADDRLLMLASGDFMDNTWSPIQKSTPLQ